MNQILNHFLNNTIVNSKVHAIVKLAKLMEKNETQLKFGMFEEESSSKFNDFSSQLDKSTEQAELIDGDILTICLNTTNLDSQCLAYRQLQQSIQLFHRRFASTIQRFSIIDNRRRNSARIGKC